MDDRLWLIIGIGIGLGIALCVWGVWRLYKRGIFYKLGIGKNDPSEKVSEEEIRQLVDAGEETGAIQQEEREMIENIFEFNNSAAEDVMIHRTDMVLLQVEDTPEEIVKTIEESGLSRFPVYDKDPDDIIGILSTREYLLNTQREQPKALRELLREPYFVPETVRTDLLFRDMQSRKVHMAIVVDEYGGTAGLVTLEDLLEEIVGNIYDEFDPQDAPDILALGGDRWRISGGAELDAVAEALDIELPEQEEYDTLGGLVFAHLAVIPEDGEQKNLKLELPELTIRVESIADHRVEWCVVEKKAKAEAGAEENE